MPFPSCQPFLLTFRVRYKPVGWTPGLTPSSSHVTGTAAPALAARATRWSPSQTCLTLHALAIHALTAALYGLAIAPHGPDSASQCSYCNAHISVLMFQCSCCSAHVALRALGEASGAVVKPHRPFPRGQAPRCVCVLLAAPHGTPEHTLAPP